MADNTQVNRISSQGDVISTDDVGIDPTTGKRLKAQRVKVQYGDDGSATDVSASKPLPVTDALGATEAKQDAILAELELKADLTETQPVADDALLTELQLKADLTETQPVYDDALLTELDKKADLTETQPVADAALLTELEKKPNDNLITFADSPNLDAFSRFRISSAKVIFDAQHHYGQKHFLFVDVLTSGGTVVNDFNNSSLTLTVTSTNGSKVKNTSRRHYYQAGHSQLAAMTFNMGAHVTGIRKSVGYYDDDDGIILERQADGTVRLVVRTSTSGTPVESESITQANWNVDPMDGTGPSGITIDWTKTQILLIDLQWLGVGRVRVAVDIDGVICPVHQFLNANSQATVYMQTANLPICYEIENVSAAAGDTFQQICSSVFSEGAESLLTLRRSISNEQTSVTVASGALTPVLSIRPSELFLTRANKGSLIPTRIEVFVQSGNNPIRWEVWEDATLTGPSWQDHSGIAEDTPMQWDVTATAATNGRWRGEGYVAAQGKGGSGNDAAGLDSNYLMQIDPAGVADTLTIMAAGIGGTAPVLASIEVSVRY